MKTVTLNNWAEFDRSVSKRHYRKWIYRGQSDESWELESSLHRAFKESQKINESGTGKWKSINSYEHEKVMIDKFKCNAHLYLSHLPKENDLLSWLSIMQHYGAPTRLLDFTFSSYIALFFALEDGEGDASIYCINHHAIKNDDDEYFGKDRLEVYSTILDNKREGNICLFAFEPTFSNQRLLSQQGLFVATNTLLFTHEEILEKYELEDNNVIKIIIPARLRYSGLRKLNQLNINSAIIYPGIDGFCKTMRRQPVFGLEWQKRIGNES
ncbi:MAG: FRG domain-containing protein [Desulfobulbaceae bacterium]